MNLFNFRKFLSYFNKGETEIRNELLPYCAKIIQFLEYPRKEQVIKKTRMKTDTKYKE